MCYKTWKSIKIRPVIEQIEANVPIIANDILFVIFASLNILVVFGKFSNFPCRSKINNKSDKFHTRYQLFVLRRKDAWIILPKYITLTKINVDLSETYIGNYIVIFRLWFNDTEIRVLDIIKSNGTQYNANKIIIKLSCLLTR